MATRYGLQLLMEDGSTPLVAVCDRTAEASALRSDLLRCQSPSVRIMPMVGVLAGAQPVVPASLVAHLRGYLASAAEAAERAEDGGWPSSATEYRAKAERAAAVLQRLGVRTA